MTHYWVFKSEPTCFSLTDLKNAPKQTCAWDGVRNYQARNFIRDVIAPGDEVFFYHSNCQAPAIVGLAQVSSKPYPDHTAWDASNAHYDPKSTELNPRWYMVDITFKRELRQPLTLTMLKSYLPLQEMILLRKGNRLSISPVTPHEYEFILNLTA